MAGPVHSILAEVRRLNARVVATGRSFGAAFSTVLVGTWSPRGAMFEVVPRDMRTTDPTRADEIMQGYFALAGRMVELDGRELFAITPPTDAFAKELHSFDWLRHLRAVNGYSTDPSRSAAAAAQARSYILNWIATRSSHPGLVRTPQIAACRALNLTNHAAFLLDSADPPTYRAIMTAIIGDIRFAFTHRSLVNDPTDCCKLVLACISVAHALVEHIGVKTKTLEALAGALADAIHRDGGPVTRRLGDLPTLLAQLLSLRALLETRGMAVPVRLTQTIDASMRMLRMVRHRDGSVARFHGTRSLARLESDLISSILTYDTERGHLPVFARNTGYTRLEAAQSVVLVDCAGPPKGTASREAHAAALAFEWSHGSERIISNAVEIGQPVGTDIFQQRQTGAQSTLCVQGLSSASFQGTQDDAELLAGGLQVALAKAETGADRNLSGRHTGYRAKFGVDHERSLSLQDDGRALSGRDRLLLPTDKVATGGRNAFTLNFHLQPGLRAKQADARTVHIATRQCLILFEANAGSITLINQADRLGYRGPRHAYQIVVTSEAALPADISWRFVVERTVDTSKQPTAQEAVA